MPQPQNYTLLRRLLDPASFLQWFVKIEGPEGMEPWKMDPYQKHLVRDFSRNRVINKSKKTGISTTIAGESVHQIYIKPGGQIVFVSTGERIASELLGKFYDELDTIPQSLQVDHIHRTTEMVEFVNKARIMSLPSSKPETIRGLGMRGRGTRVYLDEYAHVPNDNELWIVTKDFQRMDGSITMNSTPKGNRGKYYEIAEPLQIVYRKLTPYTKSEWSYHEIPFTQCSRLKNQEKKMRSEMTEIDFQQEYCCAFIDESIAFFPYQMIIGCQDIKTGSRNGIISFGVDFGKSVSQTIIYAVKEVDKKQYETLWIEVLPGVSYPDQVETLKQLNAIYNPVYISIDATGPGGQVLEDYIQKDEELASKTYGYDLMSGFKEKIIINLRILMERKRIQIPSKEDPYGEQLEMELHSIKRTTTESGEHTRYSGKDSDLGMDDMVWALALAVYSERGSDFDPVFAQMADKELEEIGKAGKLDLSLWAPE